jgi:tetratricopeptide (TPR) repeat protein
MGPPLGQTFSGDTGRLTGTVVTVDGKPQHDVLVQIQDFGTGRILASAYTNIAGGFSFEMLPYGNYELIASRETDSVRQQVEVRNSFSVVSLRLNTSDPNATSSRNGLVSLAELKVPQPARDAYLKAEQAIAKHRPAEVAKYLEKALQIYPNYAPALTLRGALSLDKDDLAAAVNDFQKAIHADDAYAMAYGAMAAALNRLNKVDDALRAAERASSLSPNSWQPYFEMAKSYVAKADYQRALQQLAHAQGQMSEEYAPLHLLRAHVLLALNNYADAAAELKSFLRIAPNDPKASAARDALSKLAAITASGTAMTGTGGPR